MSNIYKIKTFLFGVLQNLLNTNSIDKDDLDCFHRILYQEKNESLEDKEIDSLIFIILSLLTTEIKINYSQKYQQEKEIYNKNLKFNKNYTNFYLKDEIDSHNFINNAMQILT